MSATLLLVDSSADTRIALGARIEAAQYNVSRADSCDAARDILSVSRPDVVILGVSGLEDPVLDLCADLRGQVSSDGIPLIVMAPKADPATRLAMLKAGANDVLLRHGHEALLLARVRSLLRARNAANELRLREDTHRALGLAEAAQTFQRAANLALLASDPGSAGSHVSALSTALRAPCPLLDRDAALAEIDRLSELDLVVIDGAGAGLLDFSRDLFRLVSELQTRSVSRRAAQLVILPDGAEDLAALALDIGAHDVVPEDASEAELSLRATALLRGKWQQDLLRDHVRDGLEAAVTDPLTGLYNRRYAEPHLARLAAQSRRTGRPFAAMMVDIDHFKAINDTHGHQTGDYVLKGVAARLREGLRPQDLVARIGGEEFLVALPETARDDALNAAERLRSLIGDAPFAGAPGIGALRVSVSIGVAMSDDSGAAGPVETDGLFRRADTALYGAKNAGRNQVSFAADVVLA